MGANLVAVWDHRSRTESSKWATSRLLFNKLCDARAWGAKTSKFDYDTKLKQASKARRSIGAGN